MGPFDTSRNESSPGASGDFGVVQSTNRWSLRRTLPGIATLENLFTRMGPGEKLLLAIFGVLLALSTIGLTLSLAGEAMTEEPGAGGSLTEGIIGTPRFINPLLASSDADRDLAILIYSGLMRAMPDGTLITDLAQSYDISEDGTEYTFVLRDNIFFHNGEKVTAEDIAFTIAHAQNPEIKSPKRANWEGVAVAIIDERTVRFTLAQSYAPFLENLTIGILPQHLWESVPTDAFPFHQLNTNPIGSGPYQIARVATDASGTPTAYNLRSFSRFTMGEPYIRSLVLRLYPGEDAQIEAFNKGEIDAIAGVTAKRISELTTRDTTMHTHELPRVFAVFLNQSEARIFLDDSLREALDTALDKQTIIETALSGFGSPIDGPIPPGILLEGDEEAEPEMTAEERINEARAILEDGDWEINEETGFYEDSDGRELAFSLSTADTPELVASANAVADSWRLMGANVTIKVFSPSAINLQVIRPRSYDALLFGEVVGRSLDLYAFWHSSQRSDPGLNLSLYTNAKADTLLSDARAEIDRRTREGLYNSFAEEVRDDMPAIFLYAPDFVYFTPKGLKGVSLGSLTTPSERFLNVYEWHTETKKVWYLFSN